MSDGTSSGPAALYRRYRPLRFSALVGQEPIINALTGALHSGRVGHAYLFSGARGTGKTTTARILAMALNCPTPDGVEPCGTCESCKSIIGGRSLNVIEIDAASNSGVDAVRDLIAKASLGVPGNKKVYIVDEVHMLSTPAGNALLKTLEEPPDHVVFILATTDPQKVLATVRSRTQQLEFRLVRPATLSAHLVTIAADAGLSVTDAQILEAVRRANGSVRDALSTLDVLVATGSAEDVNLSGDLLDAVVAADMLATLRAVAAAVQSGAEPRRIAEDALGSLREMFLLQMGASELVTFESPELAARASAAGPKETVRLIDAFGEAIFAMRADHDARIALEVNLARYCRTTTVQTRIDAA